MERLGGLGDEVTQKIKMEETGDAEREARKRVAMIFRVIEQDNVAKRELARGDFEETYEAGNLPEPDPDEVEAAYQQRRADWESVRHMIDWNLYRQALLQEVFCGTSEYEPGTPAEKLANLRFLQEREFPSKEGECAA